MKNAAAMGRVRLMSLAVAGITLYLANPERALAQYRPAAPSYSAPAYRPPVWVQPYQSITNPGVEGRISLPSYQPPVYRPAIRAWVEPPYRPTWTPTRPYVYRPSIPVYYPPRR